MCDLFRRVNHTTVSESRIVSFVVVEHSTSVYQAGGAKVVSSIPRVAEFVFCYIYSQKLLRSVLLPDKGH